MTARLSPQTIDRLFWRALLLASGSPSYAVQPDEILSDPTLEARARHLSAGLRCLVCQNQSIDDLDAPLARDLRLLVRERLTAGDSDEAVTRFHRRALRRVRAPEAAAGVEHAHPVADAGGAHSRCRGRGREVRDLVARRARRQRRPHAR